MPNQNQPHVVAVPLKKKMTPLVILSTIGVIGASIVALNTLTGLNFRPAWAYETELLAASDVQVLERLDKVLEIQSATSKTVLALSKQQYELRLNQIDRQKRELRRELAEHQSRAQQFRDASEPVPSWIRSTIADAETTMEELNNERRQVETKIVELEQGE